MDSWRVALDIKSMIPQKMDLCFILSESDGGVDVNGSAVVYGGHTAAMHGGG